MYEILFEVPEQSQEEETQETQPTTETTTQEIQQTTENQDMTQLYQMTSNIRDINVLLLFAMGCLTGVILFKGFIEGLWK